MIEKFKLVKAVTFEGKEIKELDLSPIEDMTGVQLCEVDKIFDKSGEVAPVKELNLEYCFIVASVATGLPIELFKSLNAKDAHKVKKVVSSYFLAD